MANELISSDTKYACLSTEVVKGFVSLMELFLKEYTSEVPRKPVQGVVPICVTCRHVRTSTKNNKQILSVH